MGDQHSLTPTDQFERRLYLRLYPDSVLRHVCEPVERFDTALEDLATEMLALMRESNGIGLAAPQVGLSCQLLVGEIDNQTLSLVNPVITSRSGVNKASEGCLSLPGGQVTVHRDEEICVSAFDVRGRRIKLGARLLWARLIEHEMDHFRGILIIDHAGGRPLERGGAASSSW